MEVGIKKYFHLLCGVFSSVGKNDNIILVDYEKVIDSPKMTHGFKTFNKSRNFKLRAE